jgi:hypothetical protein
MAPFAWFVVTYSFSCGIPSWPHGPVEYNGPYQTVDECLQHINDHSRIRIRKKASSCEYILVNKALR